MERYLSTLNILPSEFGSRVDQLLDHVRLQGLAGVVLFDNFHIQYLTGFAFIPTERPIVLAVNVAGERVLLVPRLEVERAKKLAHVDRVESYLEYPGSSHPMSALKAVLSSLSITGKIGMDSDGYPRFRGYAGPSLSSLTEATVVIVADFLARQMMIKSTGEVTLIRESMKWINLAFRLLQKYTRVGANETEVSLRASMEATLAMIAALGPLYSSQSLWWHGASAGYHGQIGRGSSDCHALWADATFMPGDLVVGSSHAPMWGYHSEVERTMILGEASQEQANFFEHVKAAQEVAFDLLRPGRKCSDVDRAVLAYYEKNGLMPYWRHHTGKSVGLQHHEAPFLDSGDDTVLKPGMVFVVGPGLYVPELGGFRHGDTVVITQSGMEVLSYYPRDLTSLTLPV